MTFDRVLTLFRRKISETDLEISNLTDEELLEYIRDAAEELALRKVAGMDGLTVDPDQGSSTYGITPEPTTEQGHMLALKAAILLLREVYIGKVNRGELGMSWKSGLEEESTIGSEKAWRDTVRNHEQSLEELLLIKRAPITGTRPQ